MPLKIVQKELSVQAFLPILANKVLPLNVKLLRVLQHQVCQFFPGKAENNSEDAETKVVAQGQKQDLGKGYYQQRRQRTTVSMLGPRY